MRKSSGVNPVINYFYDCQSKLYDLWILKLLFRFEQCARKAEKVDD